MRGSAATGWTLTLSCLAGGMVALLHRMRDDLLRDGRLRPGTVAAMYSAYGAHAATVVTAARRRSLPLRLPSGPSRAAGRTMLVGGVAASLAGMGTFDDPGQVSGTKTADLVTGGIYRYSRNPQYLGYLSVLIGLGTARRSALTLALGAATGLVFRWWVPIEERHLERQFGEARLPRDQHHRQMHLE